MSPPRGAGGLSLSRWPRARLVLLALFSLAAVGLVMHTLIDERSAR